MAGDDQTGEERLRLIRPDMSAGLSLSQRLAHGLDRMIWKTPLHHLRLRGRPPLQLLAVPEDPVRGDKQAGFAILEGRVELVREEVDLGTLDFAKLSVSPALAEHIHSFAWLRDLDAAGHRQDALPIAQFILGRWLLIHARAISDPAWRPDVCGRRMLFWAAYAPLLATDPAFRRNLLNTMHRTARHLETTAVKTPVGLPRVQAAAGLVVAGLLLSGSDTVLDRAETAFARAVELSMHGDGGLVSRTPADQVALVETLAMLRAAYRSVAQDTRPIDPLLNRAAAALAGITLGDGRLSTWQGSRPIVSAPALAAAEREGAAAAPLLQPQEWGYQRLVSGDAVVIVDAAPPPTVAIASGGCASTLAFEMSDGPTRLIINCGRTDAFGPELGQGLRSTAAHSTLVLADSNSTAIHADGSLGRGVSEVEIDRQVTDEGTRLDATHQGYAKRFGFIHERQLALRADGRELRGDDILRPAAKKRPAETTASVRFHLAPGIEVTSTADGLGALLRPSGGPLWQFRCRGGDLVVEDSLWVDGTGTPKPTLQLVVMAKVPSEGLTLSWMLRRAQ
ncbi:heparinase II/III family protein [Sphingomonas sp. ID0503]|uniref:heparinase II/III family protein n=1 Tax=Sphingomonas sp. ID0503 TaxID=3399691 RepID=UPI003AFADCB5